MIEPKSRDSDKAPYKPRLLSEVVQSRGDLISSWSDLERFLTSLDGGMDRWCFRGHHRPEWPLVSSLDRMVSRGRRDAEALLIREFQRSAQHFLRSVPMKDDVLEWLALMQHHGTPTRLLDFTLSPYIGLYFALEHFPIDSGVETDVCAALWAINYVSCKGIALGPLSGLLGRGVDHAEKLGAPITFQKCFLEDHREYFVAPMRPQRHNERQSVQQALFLCPSSVNFSFEVVFVQPEGFHTTMGNSERSNHIPHDEVVRENLQRLVRYAKITTQGAREIIPKLQRMNINAESLFPGIDGYARSIKERCRTQLLRSPTDQNWNDYFD
jgi:hypothetical protein